MAVPICDLCRSQCRNRQITIVIQLNPEKQSRSLIRGVAHKRRPDSSICSVADYCDGSPPGRHSEEMAHRECSSHAVEWASVGELNSTLAILLPTPNGSDALGTHEGDSRLAAPFPRISECKNAASQ